ncbi:unnamed protein product [Notodromas monacha]|uniref:Headcase protein n=1 Tax=Notodromas monacha TaxID=399045 RepID=A0A7R9BQ05_9CRUS|nr:unnamed protein product [Notodromas monacha]CAG0918701.1 unnamed protein product [Notodromas monacha]
MIERRDTFSPSGRRLTNGGGPTDKMAAIRFVAITHWMMAMEMAPVSLASHAVLCNNDACTSGNYMHGACFREFEQGLMIYLKNCGRARSWSDKQRQQNVWTKKGYDLVYRICMCKCGRGHLRKDLDWVPPRAQLNQEVDAKKKKKKNKQNALPVLGLGLPQHQQQQQQQQQQPQNQHGAGSPPRHAGVPVAVSMAPQEPPRPRTSSMSSTGSSSCSPGSGSTSGIDSPSSPTHGIRRKSSNEICVVDRARHGSGGNSSFSRRPDFSSFNVLPRHKINSYHIKRNLSPAEMMENVILCPVDPGNLYPGGSIGTTP